MRAFINYGFPARTRCQADIEDEETAIEEQAGQADYMDDYVDQGILKLLSHRYGDGLVYLRNDSEQRLLHEAVRLGLVSSEGYVTPRGLSLLVRYGDD